MMTAADSTCKHTRADGSRCGSHIVMPSGYCHVHNPDSRATLRDVSAKGCRGKATTARTAKLIPSTLRPVLDVLLAALPKIENGSLDPRQASALEAQPTGPVGA